MQESKANGVYYTPKKLADFLVKHLNENYELDETIDILEPSCGDGIFLDAILKCSNFVQKHRFNISIVEKNNNELKKAVKLFDSIPDMNNKIDYFCGDYLEYHENNNKKYDLIIGNPPYIKRSLMSEDQIEVSNRILEKSGIDKPKVMNIWIPFLIGSIKLLKNNGILCFILPAELLQVEYSKGIRKYLNKELGIIEIFKFRELVFKDIEQDIIVLIGIKKCVDEKVIIHKLNNLDDLNKKHTIYTHEKTNNKWSEYYLTKEEMQIVDSIRKQDKIRKIQDICYSKVGIVTGANDYFILNDEESKKYNISKFLRPIIKKSSYLTKSLILSNDDFDKIKLQNKKCFMLYLDDDNSIKKSTPIYKYIKRGEMDKVNEKYKCNQRTKWYNIPSVEASDGMFFKRIHIIPKLVVNKANVLVTDTAYRIYMNEGYNIESLAFSFYNSITLLFVELLGRSYGGGVLELTPNEFKKLPVPYLNISSQELLRLDSMLKNSESIEKILEYTDNVILVDGFGLTSSEVCLIRKIRMKLLDERVFYS